MVFVKATSGTMWMFQQGSKVMQKITLSYCITTKAYIYIKN